MFDKQYLLPAEALQRVLDSLRGDPPERERCGLPQCYGRILADDIVSSEDLPAFSRSTVDGYAVAAVDTFGAKETAPAYMTLLEDEVLMGAAPAFALRRGEAAKIPTGGMLPTGADAVVMLEYVQTVSDDMIEVLRPAAPTENVIQRGEDVRAGAAVLTRGRRLRAQDAGALAGIGVTEIEVFRKPVVSIVSTGDEIVPPDRPLQPGQVRDINSYTLAGLIAEHGGVPVKKGIFRDEYGLIRKAMQEAVQDADMVLVSGGTSAGTKDMTALIINDMGAPGVLFHGVALKPGKPMIGGVVNNTPVLGLPGHPAAAVVCFDLFIRPLLERLSGHAPCSPYARTVRASMAKSIASAAGREDHIRVALERQGGALIAVPVLGKSGLITTLVKADGVVRIAPEQLGLDAGEKVTVTLF
ncbi:MAG: gephyrin-like molybdotransferase Glp [Nitrospirota bacterium]